MKNLLYVLILLILIGSGVFIYTQRDSQLFNSGEITASQSVLNLTAEYISRRAILDGLQIDTTVLSDVRFTSLRTFSKPISERPIGRDNPFTETQ